MRESFPGRVCNGGDYGVLHEGAWKSRPRAILGLPFTPSETSQIEGTCDWPTLTLSTGKRHQQLELSSTEHFSDLLVEYSCFFQITLSLVPIGTCGVEEDFRFANVTPLKALESLVATRFRFRILRVYKHRQVPFLVCCVTSVTDFVQQLNNSAFFWSKVGHSFTQKFCKHR